MIDKVTELTEELWARRSDGDFTPLRYRGVRVWYFGTYLRIAAGASQVVFYGTRAANKRELRSWITCLVAAYDEIRADLAKRSCTHYYKDQPRAKAEA